MMRTKRFNLAEKAANKSADERHAKAVAEKELQEKMADWNKEVTSMKQQLSIQIVYRCPSCSDEVTEGTSLCERCESKGIWIDPVGGLHNSNDESDPAAMYE